MSLYRGNAICSLRNHIPIFHIQYMCPSVCFYYLISLSFFPSFELDHSFKWVHSLIANTCLIKWWPRYHFSAYNSTVDLGETSYGHHVLMEHRHVSYTLHTLGPHRMCLNNYIISGFTGQHAVCCGYNWNLRICASYRVMSQANTGSTWRSLPTRWTKAMKIRAI